jgi:hypothetical protein
VLKLLSLTHHQTEEVRMVSRTLIAFVLGLSIALWSSLEPSPVRAQGAQYGEDLKEAGNDLGEANKEAFNPSDGEERNLGQQIGHAGKESGKGTGRFFKDFGRSTKGFFKKIFGGKN